MSLSPREAEVLALCVHEHTGRELRTVYAQRFGKPVSYATLYSALRRLREKGFIEDKEVEDGDGRLKAFFIVAAGATALSEVVAGYDVVLRLAKRGLAGA